ncbi:YeeE/YedE family protein [Rhizobium sp. P40RR-XXII]|uniref:YeeE/YedE family protein n=1 Tax=unclassified Rhizobium TaxID=2613769 RepID=UPI0014575501|nr:MULTISPECIES: YeeE/YedE family protein [unclassified Rhizobium]NLR85539.1 YeeE/YedE family protein [Rhizobium sp. P28RR-XV]NLS17746.1 YeeE/YedE family protein [Rhizobium sp. P40RR-XXII]
MTPYLPALLGGMLLGLSAVLLLLVNGRIAGISGIVGRLLGGHQVATNMAFILGLAVGPLAYATTFGHLPVVRIATSWPMVLAAGLLVGIGTRMGSGCTSGHGIIGLARFSKRSLAATVTFLTAGIVMATIIGTLR